MKTIFNVLQTKVNVDIQPVWNPNKEDFHFLPYLINSEKSQFESDELLKDISQIHRVVFFGICCYLENCNDAKDFSGDSFNEWMRFVWNMAYNSDVQTIDSMKNVILKINEVRDGTHKIMNFLKNKSQDNKDSYLSRQWNEEIKKAIIYDQKKEQILKAEALFHGSIRFLIRDHDLFEEQYFNRAKQELIENDQWILDILRFFPKDDQEQKISVTFYESKRDIVEIINRDEHIIEAVQKHLTHKQVALQSTFEPWIETLLNVKNKDGGVSLFDYSSSKKIQSYFGFNDIPKCIYLYNRSNWKKDECILLASEKEDIQDSITKRNDYILDKLNNNGYELYIDDNDFKNDSCPNAYEGRAIGLKHKTSGDIIYCWASGYCQRDNGSIRPYSDKNQ